MTTNFKYVPISGPISGAAVLSQTERAFNELGSSIDANTEIAQKALDVAGQANLAANQAVTDSLNAVTIATNADSLAHQALANSQTAMGDAASAVTTANAAKSAAQQANATAEIAKNEAKTAQEQIVEVKDDLTTVSGNLGALTSTVVTLLTYREADESVDVDTLFMSSENIHVTDTETPNIPVEEKGYLTVRTDSANAMAAQVFQTQDNAVYYRTAVVTENTEETDESKKYTALWTGWQQTATVERVNTKQDTLTFDESPIAGSANPVTSGGIRAAIDSAISTVYKWKGSVATVADLPSSGNAVGDVYNVTASGANYGWTGTVWDNIGGIEAVDPAPSSGSTLPVASGGVFDALAATKAAIDSEFSPSADAGNILSKKDDGLFAHVPVFNPETDGLVPHPGSAFLSPASILTAGGWLRFNVAGTITSAANEAGIELVPQADDGYLTLKVYAASPGTFGLVRPDNTTVTVNRGILSAVAPDLSAYATQAWVTEMVGDMDTLLEDILS